MIFIINKCINSGTLWLPETSVIQNQCCHRFSFAPLIMLTLCVSAGLAEDWGGHWWWCRATFLHTNTSPAHRRHQVNTSLISSPSQSEGRKSWIIIRARTDQPGCV